MLCAGPNGNILEQWAKATSIYFFAENGGVGEKLRHSSQELGIGLYPKQKGLSSFNVWLCRLNENIFIYLMLTLSVGVMYDLMMVLFDEQVEVLPYGLYVMLCVLCLGVIKLQNLTK